MKETLIQRRRNRPSLMRTSLNTLVVIVLSILTVGLFSSCSDDATDDLDTLKRNSWYIEKAFYPFGGTYNYSPDDIAIDFRNNGTFVVTSKDNIRHLNDFFNDGSHTYSVNSSEGTITIDGKVCGYQFKSNQIIIGYNTALDGPMFYLRKL